MDRRQIKTRNAIFDAFAGLLSEKNYSRISVQDIIDSANVGRSTFYAHFETKDLLLSELCEELFDHITNTAVEHHYTAETHSANSRNDPVFLHHLRHLCDNDRNILGLLSSQNNEIFMGYFKGNLKRLIRSRYADRLKNTDPRLPEDYLVNHISAAFVETVGWWLSQKKREEPEQIAEMFLTVTGPLLHGDDCKDKPAQEQCS